MNFVFCSSNFDLFSFKIFGAVCYYCKILMMLSMLGQNSSSRYVV